MQGEGIFSDSRRPLPDTWGPEEERLRAHVFFKQALHLVELSWRRDPQSPSHLMVVSVSPAGPPGAPSATWEGKYTEAFLQQLTARTGSPLSPRSFWELLVAGVKAAQEDAKISAGGPPGTEHAAAIGAFLNLWSAADLEALKRRAGKEGPPEASGARAPGNSKLFLILTRAVDGKKVHYPLALSQKTAAAATAAAAAAGTSCFAAESPKSFCTDAAITTAPTPASAAAEAAGLLQLQQHDTPRSVVSAGGPQQPQIIALLQQEEGQQVFAGACAAASKCSVDVDGLPRPLQQPWSPPRGPPLPPWGAAEALQQQHRFNADGGPLASSRQSGCTALGVSACTEGISLGVRTPAGSSAAGTLPLGQDAAAAAGAAGSFLLEKDAGAAAAAGFSFGQDAAAELLRLRALVGEQQAALAEARQQNATCRQQLHATFLRGDGGDPLGLTAQLHRVEADLFMARQRLQTERQLRTREAQRFRAEIDKLRKAETTLKTRVRELEAQLRSYNCRQRRSFVSSRGMSPSFYGSSLRCSSDAPHLSEARGPASGGSPLPGVPRGRSRASMAGARQLGPLLHAASPSAGERKFQGGPSVSLSTSYARQPPQAALRRGRSCSPYATRTSRPPPSAAHPKSGGPLGRSGESFGVSVSLLASTVSSRARQRSNSVGSCCSSSNGSNRNASRTSCACSRGVLMTQRNNMRLGPPRGPHAQHQLPSCPPQPDWGTPSAPSPSSWGPPKATNTAVPPCRHKAALRVPLKCSAHSSRFPTPSGDAGPQSYWGTLNCMHSHLGLERASAGGPPGMGPLPGCNLRERSPFAAEACCDDDALLPSTGMASIAFHQQQHQHQQQQQQRQQQQQQAPFVVLSAVEYERLRQRRSADQQEGDSLNAGRQDAHPQLPSCTDSLAAPALTPQPPMHIEANGKSGDTKGKIDTELSNASLKEGNSAATTVSATDLGPGASLEMPQVADEPSVPSLLHLPQPTAVLPSLPQPTTSVFPSRSPSNAIKIPRALGETPQGLLLARQEATGNNPQELQAGRAVFSEIDERLTALQKFLRSTRENFRLMETGTLGA